jgi:hypothetical protein
MPNGAIRIKIPPFDSAYEIVLTDFKCIIKHQYSSDLWPLKIKRNCIVDKSLAVRTVDKLLAVRLSVLVFVMLNN